MKHYPRVEALSKEALKALLCGYHEAVKRQDIAELLGDPDPVKEWRKQSELHDEAARFANSYRCKVQKARDFYQAMAWHARQCRQDIAFITLTFDDLKKTHREASESALLKQALRWLERNTEAFLFAPEHGKSETGSHRFHVHALAVVSKGFANRIKEWTDRKGRTDFKLVNPKRYETRDAVPKYLVKYLEKDERARVRPSKALVGIAKAYKSARLAKRFARLDKLPDYEGLKKFWGKNAEYLSRPFDELLDCLE